ncbi:MAG: hypothetical protein OXB88_09845 [Bacteriovoracales bacterium]|nr:hypothetical protein [Bacteriovoracales bacterium]
MVKKRKKRVKKLIAGNYVLRDIFEDSYEYEVYFHLVNSLNVSDLCPNNFEIELSMKIRKPRLSFPDEDPKLVKLMVPISKAQNNPKKRAEVRSTIFHEYADLLPQIKLSLKNQIAALRKDLVNEKEALLIDQKVIEARNKGLRKIHLDFNKSKKNVRKKPKD